ncbi:MAG: hypothetical protein J0L75_19390 [Spirochaetes bacterium]|nr:hypothetical protein [Spirochaetota bacterium]
MRPYLQRPHPALAAAQNREMAEKIEALGETGDWLVIRGFKVIDDQLAAMTGGPLSHVGIYDKERALVIESERNHGVHTTPLSNYVAKTYRMVLVRPFWAKDGGGAEAVAAARQLCGKKYNLGGILLGLRARDRYYCTDLVVDVYQKRFAPDQEFEAILMPMALLSWGRVVWDSGPRP